MKYITYRVRYAIVNREMRSKNTYLEIINWHSLGMSYNRTDAMIFDTKEEIKPIIIRERNNNRSDFEQYDEYDYEHENWMIESITEKEVFMQRLSQ